MDSRTPTEEHGDDSDATLEVVIVLAEKLQQANESIKSLEEALSKALTRATESNADQKPDELLLQRALDAETREAELKNELDECRDYANKQDLRIRELQANLKEKDATFNQEKSDAKYALLLKENAVARLKSRKEQYKVIAGQLQQSKEALSTMKVRMTEREQENGKLLTTLRDHEELQLPWPMDKYFALLDDDHRFLGRPDFISLKPVCAAGVDLRSYIEESKDLRWVTANYLQLSHSHSLVWMSTACQVGLAFGPMYIYEGSQGWKEHSVFFERDGKSLELFFEEKCDIYYAGTYELEHIRHRNPQGCVRSTVECARELSYATINLPSSDPGAKSKVVRKALQHAVETLYTQGILKAECSLLRCVGFNRQIEDILSAKHQASKALKRNAAHSPSVHKRSKGP